MRVRDGRPIVFVVNICRDNRHDMIVERLVIRGVEAPVHVKGELRAIKRQSHWSYDESLHLLR